jgi:MFS family permease
MTRGARSASGPEGMPFTAAFVALSVAELAYFTAFGLLIPVVPLFAADSLRAGPAGVGLAVGAFSVMALLLRPFAGRLVDRHGRQPLLLAGGLLFAAVTAVHLLATSLAVLVVLVAASRSRRGAVLRGRRGGAGRPRPTTPPR